MEKLERKTGVLLHITSLPSQYGVGDLGDEAYKFVDKISDNGISLWQILPTGPTGYGDSPYAARSAFAGNELFISPKRLYLAGYLDLADVMSKAPQSDRVDYGEARKLKMPMLFKAATNFLASAEAKDLAAYKAFRKEEGWWLEDYVLFQALCAKYNDSRWFSMWPKELRTREAKAMTKAKREQKTLMDIYAVLQYFFYSQWARLKAYANDKGVKIIGDIPIFVASDSSDAWANTRLLQFDENCVQSACAGVPPDAFCATGQLWGNPLYRWEAHEAENFDWWMKRIKASLKIADIIRIDHFRGFEAYWRVPQGDPTAENGVWVKGPGQKLFDRIHEVFGEDLPIIAEDLGVITPEVEALRDDNKLPGMKILQFAFGFDDDGNFVSDNDYLPHNTTQLSVLYTGTHDNNTTVGWYKSLDERTKDVVRKYFECSDGEVLWRMIRCALMSTSFWVVLPMQDILGRDEKARMNVPSTCGTSNWSWKMDPEDLDTKSMEGIKYYSKLFGRTK